MASQDIFVIFIMMEIIVIMIKKVMVWLTVKLLKWWLQWWIKGTINHQSEPGNDIISGDYDNVVKTFKNTIMYLEAFK